MKRISFTVTTKSGVNYDANQLTATWRDGDSHPMLSFVCSGRQMTLPAEDIETVKFCPGGGASHCPTCDQSLVH